MPRRTKGDRVHGPYPRGDRWIVVVVRSGARADRSFGTPEEAEAVAREARAQLGALTTSVGVTVAAYLDACRRRGVRVRTLDTYEKRLAMMLEPVWGLPLASLTPARAAKLYDRLVGEVAVDTHRGALISTRSWANWCVDVGHARTSPFAKVKGVGRRRRGKPQLTVTEARTLLELCLARAPGDRGAVIVAALLLLGCRASELLQRRVRDLDDGGRLLWIPEAKTDAGRRVLEVPAAIRPHLVALAGDRDATELLVGRGGFTREGAWAACRRLCKMAGVPVVCPHGLRGTHSTIARAAGATAELVAGQLGHAGTAVQDAHYVAGGVAELVTAQRTLRVLDGGR